MWINDVISREALKKTFTEECCGLCDNCSHYTTVYKCELIDNAPTVCGNNPKWCENCVSKGKCASTRPHGKWIITSEDTEGIHHIKCPFCKYEKGSEFTPYIKVTFDKLPYFCENCGAKMDKEVDNEL